MTDALPSPAAVRKAEREIAEFRDDQRLGRELVEVNEKICRLRPLEQTLTPQEKKRRDDPAGSRARRRATAPDDLHRCAQNRTPGSGSRRDAGGLCPARGSGRCADGVAACQSNEPFPAPAVTRHAIASCAPKPFSPCSVRPSSHVLTICARSASRGSSPPIRSCTSWIRSSRPACAVCKQWWVSRALRSKAASNSSCWPICK